MDRKVNFSDKTSIYLMLGDNYPLVSYISIHLLGRDLNFLFSILFKISLQKIDLEDRHSVPAGGKIGQAYCHCQKHWVP